jgi:hypothetical protein
MYELYGGGGQPDTSPSDPYRITAIPPLDARPVRPGRRVVVSLMVLHGLELAALIGAARVAARLARAHPGHSAWLPTLLIVAAIGLIGWQSYRLARGHTVLNVPGMVVQSVILMVAITVATQRLVAGAIGIVLASMTLALWDRLAARRDATGWTAPAGPALDALCGTLYLPANRWPGHYGVDDVEPPGYLRQVAWPFHARCGG